MFVDRVKIQAIAGKGGAGSRSFRREKFVPHGGPDGGNGGDGGSIILLAEEGVDSLAPLAHRMQWKATPGQPGMGDNCYGKRGEDLTLKVPPGTVVYDADTNLIIKDLARPGDSVIAARGGRGGLGNLHFKTPTNRAPRESTPGGEGESKHLILELKIIADVGLIGKPNAGKSTLLSRLSRARPEIAPYPFTTKYPNLGRVQIDFDHSFVLADLPGLIDGAHAGVGLGHEFLRHIERSGLLVHLVEPAPTDGSDPVENYRTIRHELSAYDAKLGERPEIVAMTKAELPEAGEAHARFTQEIGREVFLISAVTGEGLNKLMQAIRQGLQAPTS